MALDAIWVQYSYQLRLRVGSIDWLFDQGNSAMVGGWGLILSALGFIVTLVGFGVTIWQLLRTQRSVDAARIATEQLRTRLSGQSAAIHSASGNVRLKTALRELRSGQWAAAADALDELREILLLLHRRTDHVNEDLRQQLPAFLKDLIEYVSYLEKNEASGVSDKKRSQIARRLRELSSLLMSLSDDLSERTR